MSSIGPKTTHTQTNAPEQIFGWTGVVALTFLSLLVRYFLIGFNQTEYTDGIIQLNVWDSPVVFFPPGYSAAVWLFESLGASSLIAGQLVSILASAACMPLIYLLAREVLDDEGESFWAAIFLALSPILNRWAIRVMTDAFFLPWFILGCWLIVRGLKGKANSAAWLLGVAGIASLVRYQGFYFIPWVGVLIFLQLKTTSNKKFGSILIWIISVVPWALLVGWIAYRGFGHTEQFVERGSFGFWLTALLYYNMFETFLIYWPWAITHLLFVIGVIGWFVFAKGTEIQKRFAWFALITSLVFLVAQSAFLSFQYRYLLPLLPLWCVAAGRGIGYVISKIKMPYSKSIVTGLVAANLLIMTSAVLLMQRGAFGDIAQCGTYFSDVWKDARLLSNERYGHYPIPFKMQFWSQREVLYYPVEEPKVGDIIVLHNTSGDIAEEFEYLSQRFQLQKLGDWRSSSTPLLPDIMVTPPMMTSNPPAMGYRFTRQDYYTLAVRLEAKP
ncbi:MAG: glycosyltransferase family 39 protein [Candidatus Hinthialibacter antarcticus]|nr:glycosyltransferase family 39 protein [Candidatus Hinthialibacter antarcticus]